MLQLAIESGDVHPAKAQQTRDRGFHVACTKREFRSIRDEETWIKP